jgi:hypothetical protein
MTFFFGIWSILCCKNLKNIARPNFKIICNTMYFLVKNYFKSLKCHVELHILLIYYVTLRTLHNLMSYNARVHTSRPPGCRGDYIYYCGA